ncbi:hypothetical protein KSP40_PGU002736 [Platanthera guangdongensis]|uniref:Uncharacterized protein n=1 Tax=Platanthera guangdongensis TaxID=2320717 RepID=A0ABR2MIW7_9ASPA
MIIFSPAVATTASLYSRPATAAIFTQLSGGSLLTAAPRFLNRSISPRVRKLKRIGNQEGRVSTNTWRAELVHDAPFAAAIGACVLTSLVSPILSTGGEDDDGGGAIDSTDARFAVMAIIGFIPYFNWLVSKAGCLRGLIPAGPATLSTPLFIWLHTSVESAENAERSARRAAVERSLAGFEVALVNYRRCGVHELWRFGGLGLLTFR